MATSEDTATIKTELENLREDFSRADNDSLFLVRNQSTTPFNGVFIRKDEIKDDYAAVLNVKVGEVTDVLHLGTSAAIIKKLDERGKEIKFAVLSASYEALPATLDAAFEAADEFLYYASEESTFDEEAERSGYTVGTAFATEGNSFISGLGSSQQVLSFLETGKYEDISEPIELATQFVVLKITEINDAGTRPLKDVRTQIETQVKNEKRRAITLNKVNEMLATNSTIDALSNASGLEIQSTNGVAANATILNGAGREPGIIGSVFSLKTETLSPALEGNSGAYVILVNSKEEPAENTLDDATASSIKAELEQQINSKYLAVWLEQLEAEADIVDNRNRLLR